MLITEGERHPSLDLALACILAAIAGALNSAVFYAVGFFAANMTGNVSLVSTRVVEQRWELAGFSLLVVAIFIAGAFASSLLIEWGRRRQMPAIYARIVLVESLVLAAMGAILPSLPDLDRVGCLVLGVAFSMGIQNAIATQLSGMRVRTTHISGAATDLGIGLASKVGRRSATSLKNQGLAIYALTIVAFLFGGVAGVVIYRQVGVVIFWIAAGMLAFISAMALRRARKIHDQ